MQKSNSTELLKFLRERYAVNWRGPHGGGHWARVRRNGLILSKATGANTKVVQHFALFHDSCRINESRDDDHGKRGADLAVKLRGKLFEATDLEMSLLVQGCTEHTCGYVDADVTVQICWDADRLDLGRVGIYPDPDRLCTAAAKDPVTIELAYQRSIRHVKNRT